MRWTDRFFLVKVYRESKWMFTGFIVFVVMSLYINWKGIETTPFFIWAMYSGRHPVKTQYEIITIHYNDNQVINFRHTYQEPRSMMLYFTFNQYRKMLANGMVDPLQPVLDSTVLPKYPFLTPAAHLLVSSPADNAGYPAWLKRYIQSLAGIPIDSIQIYRHLVHYAPNGRVVPGNSQLIYTIQ